MTEMLIASAIAVLTACGLYLMFQRRSFPVILGATLLSYAVNFFLFASGRLVSGRPPLVGLETPTDPIPQALVLTAIVISFGMSAVLAAFAVASFRQGGDDRTEAE